MDRAVGIVTGCGLDDLSGQSSSLGRVKNVQKLWGQPSHLSDGYRGLFPTGQSGQDVKLTSHLHLVPSSTKRGSVHPLLHMP
jgi:hypothetical protein